MSSPSQTPHIRYNVPPPRHDTAPSLSGHDYSTQSTPRSSFDQTAPRPEASSSRRQSQASIHYSPTSISSSLHRQQQYGSQRSLQDANSRGPEPGYNTNGNGGFRPPRITTTNVEHRKDGEDDGPKSAPISGPLMPPSTLGDRGPLRSASSPEPRQVDPFNSSPTDHRPNAAGTLKFPQPYGHAASRQTNGSSSSERSHGLTAPPSHNGEASSRPLRADSSVSSHSSLTSAHQHHNGPTGSSLSTISNGSNGSSTQPSQQRPRGPTAYCGVCGQVVTGQFVRAMQKVFHLDCFRCKVGGYVSLADHQDCNKVVAQKFFPVEDVEGIYPLCERDYFARLDLICAKCNEALRSSYITACGESSSSYLSYASSLFR
jgi:hypothetical protein